MMEDGFSSVPVRLRGNAALAGALSIVTAAVVGAIADLAVWLACGCAASGRGRRGWR